MEEGLKYFMLTDAEERFADVFSDVASLRSAYVDMNTKLDVRTWLLTPTTAHPDVYLAELDGKLVVCIGPKHYVGGEYKGFKKVEIRLNV